MRLYHVLLLAAVLLLASVPADATVSGPKIALPAFVRTLTGNAIPVSRSLRADNEADNKEEERAFNIPGLEKLKSSSAFEKVSSLFKRKITPGTLMGWAKKQRSPDKVFVSLKLDKAGDKLLENPAFNVWVAYTRMATNTNPERAILTSLTARYGDVALAKMIEMATKVESSKGIATQLQKMQLDGWKSQGMSANALFKLLKLDDNVDTLLKNPNLSTWAKYMTEVSATDSKLKTPMIDTLRAHFSDKELVRVFNAAKSDPQTKKLATDLEGALINQLRLARLKKAQ